MARHDADDDVRAAIDGNRGSDHGGVALEHPAPQIVIQHGDSFSARPEFVGDEHPPEQWRRLRAREKRRRDFGPSHGLGLPGRGDLK